MTEIDRLRRITLRDVKPLLNLCERLRGQFLAITDESPERTGEAIEALNNRLRARITFTDNYESTSYTIQGEANEDGEIESLLFLWECDGAQRSQRVWLTSRPSNLKEGASCLYFLCPSTNRICRKLYTDGRVLVSRYGFDHTYSERNYSRRRRANKKALALTLFVEDEANRGKREIYKGKLTRYGRKIRKLAGGETYADIMANQAAILETLFAVPPRRGRPPKPKGAKEPETSTPPLFMK